MVVESAEGSVGRGTWPAASPPAPVPVDGVGLGEALSRSSKRILQVSGAYWVIAMVVAVASFFVGKIGDVAGLVGLGADGSLGPVASVMLIVVFLLFLLLLVLVLIPLGAGTTRAALAVFRGEPVRLSYLGAGFRRFGAVVSVAVMTMLPLFVAGVLAVLVGGVVWTLLTARLALGGAVFGAMFAGLFVFALLLVPAVYVALRWSFALFLVFDKEIEASEALRRSWHLTKGRLLALLGVGLITGFASALAGVAPPLLVFTTGWTPLAIGEIYMDARGGALPPVRNWERETWADRVVVRDDED